MSIFEDEATQSQDDFDVEIADLPSGDKSHQVLTHLTAPWSRLSSTFHSPRSSQNFAQNFKEDDGFEIEITTLSGEANAPRGSMRRLHARSQSVWHRRTGQALTCAGIFIALAVLLFGNVPLLRGRASDLFRAVTSKPDQTTSSISPHVVAHSSIIIAPAEGDFQITSVKNRAGLDNPPACQKISPVQSSAAPSLPKGVGQSPLWVTGFTGPVATLNHLIPTEQSPFGWYQQVTLVLDTGYDGSILIQGGEQDGNGLLLFNDSAAQPLMNSLVVNPRQPASSSQLSKDGQHVAFPMSLYVPQAGCYFLQADWAGGSWTEYFAAGREP